MAAPRRRTDGHSELNLLSHAQRRQLLSDWSATGAQFPTGTLPELFSAQVRRTPEADAIIDGARRLSYVELDRAADGVAAILQQRGVGPGSVVGVALQRSLETVVAAWAILKAGGVYLPLDPAYPAQRLAYMLHDAHALLVLTDQHIAQWLPADVPQWRIEDAVPANAPHALELTGEALAYIVYTSGSTGEPKGVAVSHASAVNLAFARTHGHDPIGAGDRVLAAISVGFDVSIGQLLLPLLSGACVVIAPDLRILSAEAFWALLAAQRVTHINSVPSFFDSVLDAAARQPNLCLKRVMLGGEAFSVALCRRLRAALPQTEFFNMYGPTEACIDATAYRIPDDLEELDQGLSTLPIGQPLANYRVYVLDARLQPMPPGAPGELYIGGVGLARGYVGNPQLTAERFLADPFGLAGERLYRTGDRALWRPDGTLVFLGRSDEQLKIRGFRVEPGEIEARLRSHARIAQAAVVLRTDTPQVSNLVAYLVADGAAPSIASLREHLAQCLPDHMIPSGFVFLDALPLTPNGKLDRHALPRPDPGSGADREYQAPVGTLESQMALIWQGLLGAPRIGREDDFFELGGHSLLAVQLVSRLRQQFGVELALAQVFAEPTLRGVASATLSAGRSAQSALAPADRSQPLPLSWAQQSLWFLEQLDHAAGAAYHLPAALRLTGTLDRDALRATLNAVVARHEVLRTRFQLLDGQPVQRIAAPDVGFHLLEHDLAALSASARQQRVRELSEREATAPFELSTGPLIRGQLLRLGEDDHLLLITQHHIISDGWSSGILLQDIATLYGALSQGQPNPLPALSLQYADYALWQRQWLRGQTLASQLDFWKTHLAGAPALLELPTDRPRPAAQRYTGSTLELTLPAQLTAGLRTLSQRHGVTLFMTLLAGWSVVLSRLSGQSDLVIGAPVANRGRSELESLLGLFVNTLALRVKLASDPSVAELLAQVRSATLAAYAHQDVAFAQVVEALQPARSLSYNPIFQVMLAFDNAPGERVLSLPGLKVTEIEPAHTSAQFDLVLDLRDAGQNIAGCLEYATDLFDHATVERIGGHLLTLLEAMVADDRQRIGDLNLLSPAERRQVLSDWNATAAHYPSGTLPQLLSAQVACTPEADAIIDGPRRLSYAELDRAANGLAATLQQRGVGPETVVGVALQRSLESIVAAWAILKAGGVYLPLDPAYPAQRLAYMLRDARARLVLTDRSIAPRLPEEVPQWRIEDAVPQNAPHPVPLTPENLAYIIYTSGSTGEPKGVAISHASAVNLAFARRAGHDPIGPGDRVLAATSVGFDVSIGQLLLPLLSGACVVIAPDLRAVSAQDFWALLAAQRVTQIDTVPSFFETMLDARARAAPLCLKRVLLGGEALPAALCRRLRLALPDIELFNVYGPTEACIDATVYRVPDELDDQLAMLPIGRPLANCRVYVLDARGRPMPPGVAGELYIGGAGLARGYVGNPQLTAERFLADPFGLPDERLYRTGDRALWRADGTLLFLGRLDEQLKIRGFRIEPAEIEARLRSHPQIAQAAVVLRSDAPRAAILVAYLVANGAAPSIVSLREHLAQRLPDPMIPGAFVFLDALPLTPNGKLDRQALPPLDPNQLASREYQAPVGTLEIAIARIWQQLLARERVGRHDNFFELGGHSLLAVQLLSRLRAQFGVELALAEVFSELTLQSVAQAVLRAERSAQPPLTPIERSAPLPLSWAQQRLWFLDQLDHAAGAAYHVPAGLRLTGTLDRDALRAALNAMVARHEVLRTRFVALDGEPLQHIAAADVGFHLVEHDLAALSASARQQRVRELSQSEAAAPFDLSSGPLIRGQLLRLAPEDHVLLMTQHHIISDGWSTGILLQEISALYGALSQGQPDPLPPLSLQYADYALWQRQWLREEVLAGQVSFWKAHLAGAPALLELPTDRPRPAMQGYAGDTVALTLPPELTAGLRTLSQRHGVTLFMTLLAGWTALLCRLSGQSDLVIGTPVANRQRSELESMVGFFVNTLALRVNLACDPSVAELLAQVRSATLDAYAHQDIPFAQVVEALQPPRSLSYNPIFQVMLAFDNAPGERALSLPGLKVTDFDQTLPTAKFDLLLSLTDAGQSIAGYLEYATDLFDRATIERMAGHLLAVLQALVADDRQRISAVNLLSPSQREQLLLGFNNTSAPYPSHQCIHELFEAQVARTPDAIAVVCEARELSYAELNAHANQLAHHLVALGIGPDDRVAICCERSLEMLVGLLGILKAGGAYVPLDPSYPTERLAWMLEDSAPAALLTQSAVRDALPAIDVPEVVLDLNHRSSLIAREPQHNPDAGALGLSGRHLAYVIYTSGSTGLPKGVMVEHGSVVNFLSAMARAVQLSAHDVLLAVTTLSFDIAALELYLPLTSGARVVIASRASAADAETLSRLIGERAVSLMQATPATWRLLLDHGWNGAPGLRALCGGEALPTDLSAPLATRVAALWNLYGPTETAIWSTMARIDGQRSAAIASIGRPIANTQIYLLDAVGQPAPVGVRAEIFIAGAGVARGYLKRPGLTADRFVSDPFSADATARMYRTGDLARWRADGTLEYLGRNDLQLKLRGFRIEPGEIEACLTACRGVREAVVVARQAGPGDQRLVAYLTRRDDLELSAAQLRAELASALPDHMIPSAFVFLDALPLTPNGKLDRKALPSPDQSAVASRQYRAPLGATEMAIARIWQQLLGLERVGRDDNFFELGGHSLLVLKMLAAFKAQSGRSIAMAWVFQAPTPAQLAALVDQQRTDRAWKHLVVLNQGANRNPLFCLNGFDGDVNDYLHIARFVDPTLPVYGLEVSATAQDEGFRDVLDRRMDVYEQEIRSIQPQGPYRLCGFSFGGSEAFHLARRLEDAGEQVLLILIDAFRPSKSLVMLSWGPRMLAMLRARTVFLTARRKLRNLVTYELHRWLTGKDKDLRHALFRHAMTRVYKPFSGKTVLIKSNGIEDWAFQLRLDEFNGWKKYIKGSFDVIHIDAGHVGLIKEPAVKTLASHLDAILRG